MKIQILFFILALFFKAAHALDTAGLDAIYGLDDRLESEEIKDKKIKSMTRSVGMVVSSEFIKRKFFYSTIEAVSMQQNLNVCSDVKFSQQLTVNGCTAFLVAPDVMISAGHCFPTADCRDQSVVFDITLEKERNNHFKVSGQDIYQCSEVLKHAGEGEGDFALIRLQRKTNRSPLQLRTKGELRGDDEVFMLGHPLGSALKFSQKVKPSDISETSSFKAPLDSFSGNSGSPVINARTLKVEGILVNGAEDFLLDETKQCYRFMEHNSSADESPKGEGVTRINQVLPFLPQ